MWGRSHEFELTIRRVLHETSVVLCGVAFQIINNIFNELLSNWEKILLIKREIKFYNHKSKIDLKKSQFYSS